MSDTDLRAFLARLEERGDLVRIGREVDPKFELSAVLRHVQRELAKAVIFEHVKGYNIPVVSNLWGHYDRVGMILDVDKTLLAKSWGGLEDNLAQHPAGLGTIKPDDYEEISLDELPIITHCEKDGGPYITGGVALARDPATGTNNLSYHRMQVISNEELRLRITPGHHLAVYHEAAEASKEPLPVAILIGAPPSVMLAAGSRLPLYTDELRLAAAFEDHSLSAHQCQTIDLQFPTGTEIVIEGEILPGVRKAEGPFGDFLDYYIPVQDNHVMKVRGVFKRPGALYYDIFSGSVEELLLLAVPVAANIYRAVHRVVPSVIDVACWPFVYNCVVKMHEQFDGQAKQALLAALGAEPTWVKICTVVDEDVDIYDPADVIWAVSTRSRPDRDVIVIPGVPSFRRDPEQIHWGRLGIDATIPPDYAPRFERKRVPGEKEVKLSDYL